MIVKNRILKRGYCLGVLGVLCAMGCTEAASQTNPANRQADRPSIAEPQQNAAGDWPNWRGPEHDGISRETGWSATWPEPGPTQLWKTNVGTGFSSFAVADGRLYTMGHRDADDTVYCLDANTGNEIWKHSYPCALVDNLHEGGPAATPTVDDGRVYTLSKEGELFCLDAAKGDVLWSAKLQDLLGVEMPTWGFSCSPRVWNDLLIVEAGRTCAFNRKTGELAWKTEAFRPGYGSPAIMRHGDKDLAVVLNNDFLLFVQAEDGKEVAKQKWETLFATSSTTPVIDGDTVFVSTGYNQGCALFRLTADNQVERIYQNKVMSNHMANCVLWESFLYGIDGNSSSRRNCEVVCMDAVTGGVKWKHRGLGCGSLLIADGKLVVLGDEGDLVVARASPDEFKITAKAHVIDGKCWTVPVLSHGRLYCRNADGDVVCLDLRQQ